MTPITREELYALFFILMSAIHMAPNLSRNGRILAGVLSLASALAVRIYGEFKL